LKTDRKASIAGAVFDRRARAGVAGVLGSSVLVLTACSSAPSRNILGSYFPSWMICALVGMGATVGLRLALVQLGIDAELPAPVVISMAFTIAVSLGMWLVWLA